MLTGVTIALSSTTASPDGLSSTFSANIGADATTVFSGNLTLSSAATGGSPLPFDIVIPLATTFTFNPAGGKNLLLDVAVPVCGTTTQFDAEDTSGDAVSRVVVGNVAAASGVPSSFGLVTQFSSSDCGDGVMDVGEQCDDGNTLNGDCCSSTCQYDTSTVVCRASGGACDLAESCTGSSGTCPADAKQPNGTGCDDGSACTQTDQCDGAGTCVGTDPLDCDDGDACTADSCTPLSGCINDDAPATGCLTPGKSIVLIKSNASDHSKDKLLWKWIKGAVVSQANFADPLTDTDYALCIYAGAASSPIARLQLPAGAGWSGVGTKGYKFNGASPDGLSLALLKGGADGKSKALTKGKGATLPDPTLPLTYPVTVQLKKDGSALCLESSFTAADEVKNDAAQFKAKK